MRFPTVTGAAARDCHTAMVRRVISSLARRQQQFRDSSRQPRSSRRPRGHLRRSHSPRGCATPRVRRSRLGETDDPESATRPLPSQRDIRYVLTILTRADYRRRRRVRSAAYSIVLAFRSAATVRSTRSIGGGGQSWRERWLGRFAPIRGYGHGQHDGPCTRTARQ